MSEQESPNPQPLVPKTRLLGGTEKSWCKAVLGGTGITVLALLLSKPPNLNLLQTSLNKLQNSHPILNSKLHFKPTTNSFSYTTSTTPHLHLHHLNPPPKNPENSPISTFHLILQHELNTNPWCIHTNNDSFQDTDIDLFFASLYTLSDEQKWVLVLRLHTSVCDRTSAVSLLREMVVLMSEGKGGGVEREVEMGLGVEEYIPSGKGHKRVWARGVDMLGYSLNSFRLANLEFKDSVSPRASEVVRLQLSSDDTHRILLGCKSRGIKLCSLLAAAGLIAAHSKGVSDRMLKFAVVTLIDCRSILQPVLSCNRLGFYHSAILNTHDIKGREEVWELAKRTYTSFANAKNKQKHFSDMADLNFLMIKAINNPGLTPSSSLRTSLISVFEEPVIDHTDEIHGEIGLEEYICCGSVHGVGPSIAIFDRIRDGALDCVFVYPSPLHSREQMQELVDDMKRILVTGR